MEKVYEKSLNIFSLIFENCKIVKWNQYNIEKRRE